MVDLSVVRAGIDRRIDAENQDLTMEAWITLGTGIAFGLLTFGFVYALIWMLTFLIGVGQHSEAGVAAAITGVFFVTACFAAWRRVDPLANLEPEDANFMGSAALTLATGFPVAFRPRQATAGAAAFLVGGPTNVFEAIGQFRSRMPSDPALVNNAAELLVSAESGCRMKNVGSAEAFVLLRRLGLLRMLRVSDGMSCQATEKGQAVIQGRG